MPQPKSKKSIDSLFLDANVLFSAAYRNDAGVRVLWSLDAELVTSAYAVQEARRNLAESVQQQALDTLLENVEVVDPQPIEAPLPDGANLPEKDQPILAAAIAAKCTHLITGDARHFGKHFGQRLGGVLIMRPAAYMASRPR